MVLVVEEGRGLAGSVDSGHPGSGWLAAQPFVKYRGFFVLVCICFAFLHKDGPT